MTITHKRRGKTPISAKRWSLTTGAINRTRADSIGRFICEHFTRPAIPSEILTDLSLALVRSQKYLSPSAKARPRSYLHMKLFEMRKHGFFKVQGEP